MKKSNIKCAIYIAGATQASAKHLKKLTMKILHSSAGDAVKIRALEIMSGSLSTHASVSNCSVEAPR